MPGSYRFERALFVLGEPNSGKSYQIRQMFRDVRFGNNGSPLPKRTKNVGTIEFSNERMLYVRIASPQEAAGPKGKGRESVSGFLSKIRKSIKRDGPDARWNIVCPMQPGVKGHNPKMVGGIELMQIFIDEFQPERVRVAVLNPPREGELLPHSVQDRLVDQVRNLKNVDVIEPLIVDARRSNGLLLPDFFDFT